MRNLMKFINNEILINILKVLLKDSMHTALKIISLQWQCRKT